MRHGKLSHAAVTAVLCLIGVTLCAGSSAATTLTGMSVVTEGEVTRIHVTLDEPVEFSHFTLTDPARLFIDCRGVSAIGPESLPMGGGRAGKIEASVWQGEGDHALTRIAVDLARPSETKITEAADGLVITLSPQESGSWELGSGIPAEAADKAEDMTASEMTASEMTAYEPYEYALPEEPSYVDGYTRTEPAVTAFTMHEEKGLAGRGGPRVSLDIQGADIYAVLRSISEYSGVNIVMGFDVRAKVNQPLSFHLNDVPWGEALEMVLRSAHLWYREESGIIRVDTEENLRQEDLTRSAAARQLEDIMPLTTRIVNVVYATAGELRPAVAKSLSTRGVIEVDDRTNSLVVTDIPARVEAAVEMIQHLDSQTPQVEIVAKLVDVDAKYTRELGVLWRGTNIDPATGSPPGDISIRSTFIGDDFASAGSNTVAFPTGDVMFGLVKSWGEVQSLLSVMEQENKANIISNPRITTVNNREARILVGKKIPLIVLDEAGNPVTNLTTIGITLRVTPHINDNNRITLDLHPEVSDLASQATVQGGVIINTSEADTRVMVENGETAVIGGLIRANDTYLERGIPILRDIPIVGSLFKGSSKVREKRELLIFVTPRIVNSFASSDQN